MNSEDSDINLIARTLDPEHERLWEKCPNRTHASPSGWTPLIWDNKTWVDCPECNGTSWLPRITDAEILWAEREFRQLEDEVRHAAIQWHGSWHNACEALVEHTNKWQSVINPGHRVQGSVEIMARGLLAGKGGG